MLPTDGLWIWIWNWRNCEGGSAQAVAAKLQAIGARGAILKVADGGSWFDQGAPASAIAQALKAQGTQVATWQYCYGADPAAEAQRGIETIQGCQPAFHVLDIEQEFENQAQVVSAATQLASTLKAAAGQTPLAYSPLPAIRYHLRLPYRQLTDAGLSMLPQLYWTGLQWTPQQTVDWFYQDADQYSLTSQPIAPAYEDAPGVQPTDADHAAFLALVQAKSATGLSVWSYEHLDATGWARAARAAAAIAPATGQASAPADPCADLRAQLAALSADRDRIAAILAAVKTAVA